MNKLTAAIACFEDTVRESDDIIAECSPELQEQLTEQKQHFAVALEVMRKTMGTCIHNNGNYCEVLSDAEVKQPCIKGPCPFDAAPVIRCGECKSGKINKFGAVVCYLDNCVARHGEDFCSYGERAKMDKEVNP